VLVQQTVVRIMPPIAAKVATRVGGVGRVRRLRGKGAGHACPGMKRLIRLTVSRVFPLDAVFASRNSARGAVLRSPLSSGQNCATSRRIPLGTVSITTGRRGSSANAVCAGDAAGMTVSPASIVSINAIPMYRFFVEAAAGPPRE